VTTSRHSTDTRPAKKAELSAGMSAADAFQSIVLACLRQLLADAPLLQAMRDPEAVHRMRVAVRRLRAALSLFRDIAADREVARLKRELRWLAGALAAARDLDVFIAGTLAPARAAEPSHKGLAALVATFESRRAAAYDSAIAAVASERFRRLAVATAAWSEGGPWLTRAKAAAWRKRPIPDFAARELSRRRRRVRKNGKRLAELDAPARHALRIAVKKLRYAADFFSPVYDGKRRSRRAKAFRGALAELQDRLGALNDITVAEQMTEGLEPRAAAGARRLAVSQAARFEEELERAARAQRAFADAEPFWR
jgi:triphosphatase